ncbi:unnamed protein product [Dovyalis caffra]|uniref:Uncharacterized protein n=1 Tax=Dovyalis caffra TaxID=77055 RepID=A0AAV1S5X3_9ROSI|nr:unnamed protein product [Dovyalis caffra]
MLSEGLFVQNIFLYNNILIRADRRDGNEGTDLLEFEWIEGVIEFLIAADLLEFEWIEGVIEFLIAAGYLSVTGWKANDDSLVSWTKRSVEKHMKIDGKQAINLMGPVDGREPFAGGACATHRPNFGVKPADEKEVARCDDAEREYLRKGIIYGYGGGDASFLTLQIMQFQLGARNINLKQGLAVENFGDGRLDRLLSAGVGLDWHPCVIASLARNTCLILFGGYVQRRYDCIYFSGRMIGERLNASYIHQEVASTALQWS